jgi:hypothetical protein
LSSLKLLFNLNRHFDDLWIYIFSTLFELNHLIVQFLVFLAQLLYFFWFDLLLCLLWLWNFELSNLQDKFVFLFFQTIDFLDQRDILLHNLVVLLRVELGVLFQSNSHILQIGL